MELEKVVADLRLENEHLKWENEELRTNLRVLEEAKDRKSSVESSSPPLDGFTDTKSTRRWQTTLDEKHFQENLKGSSTEREHQTSSPVDFRSLVLNSMSTQSKEQTEITPQLKISARERLLGEIAFQLDKRILFHVFQGQRRLYGFTVLNIHHKIIEVSTHPLTGKVDEGYRLFLSQRYADLMVMLQRLGFKPALHPVFTEFIVNTYGILKEKHVHLKDDVNDPDVLREVVVITAPTQLQKDLLVVLTCLCSMAEKDKMPLLLW